MDYRMKREEAHGESANRSRTAIDRELRVPHSLFGNSRIPSGETRVHPSIDKWMRTHGGIVARLIPVIIPRCGCGRPTEGRGGRAHNAALHGAWCTIKDPGRCTFTHVQRRGRTL